MKFITTEILNYKRFHFEIIDSTNLQAKKFIDTKTSDNFIISADTQTNGRGRKNREWISEEGNLFFSISIKIKPQEKAELLTYIAALSLNNYLDDLGVDSTLKWPNDVLVNGKKLSGILLEKHLNYVIIGIGINIISSPKFTEHFEATHFAEFNKKINKEDVLLGYLKHFNINYKKGFADLKNKIESKLDKKSSEISIGQNHNIKAKIVGLTDEGELKMISNGKEININYGEFCREPLNH